MFFFYVNIGRRIDYHLIPFVAFFFFKENTQLDIDNYFILDPVLNMTHLTVENNELDINREDEQLSVSGEYSPRNLRLQSFVQCYGIDEPYKSPTDQIKHYFKKHCASLSFLYCLNAFLDKIPLLRCLKEYNIRKNLFGDIVAGITVAIMHIPQGKQQVFF